MALGLIEITNGVYHLYQIEPLHNMGMVLLVATVNKATTPSELQHQIAKIFVLSHTASKFMRVTGYTQFH